MAPALRHFICRSSTGVTPSDDGLIALSRAPSRILPPVPFQQLTPSELVDYWADAEMLEAEIAEPVLPRST